MYVFSRFNTCIYRRKRKRILDIINKIQKDAYNQALEDVVKNAEVDADYSGFGDYPTPYLNKQSILKLKK